MANRSIDRIRNKKSKDDPVIFWMCGDYPIENNEVVYAVTGDYQEDPFLEITDCDIASE